MLLMSKIYLTLNNTKRSKSLRKIPQYLYLTLIQLHQIGAKFLAVPLKFSYL